jgi:hypothetical protein
MHVNLLLLSAQHASSLAAWPRWPASCRALTADTGRKSFKPVFTEEALDWKIHRAAQTPGPGATACALMLLRARQPAMECFSLTSW